MSVNDKNYHTPHPDGKKVSSKKEHSAIERLFVVLRFFFILLVLLAAIYNSMHRQWEGLLIAVLTIVLLLLPAIFCKKTKITIPMPIQLFALIFVFASMYLGEMRDFYYRFHWWDSMLHSTSAVVLGYIGFILIYALNRDRSIHLRLSPFFIALFSFCFAMTIGVLWEIFEFMVDEFLGYNMQKARNLEDTYGYFCTRLGVLDTMKDFIVNTIGAAFVSIIGYYYSKNQMKKNKTFGKLKDEFIETNPDLFDK